MPLFPNESKCETFHVKMSSASHFRKNGFTLTLALKQTHKRTRRCPIILSFDWFIGFSMFFVIGWGGDFGFAAH